MRKPLRYIKSVFDAGELKLFRALWNHSDDSMFVVLKDAAGDFITEKSNHSLVNLFNLSTEQASGCSLKTLLPADSYQVISDRYNECLTQKTPFSYEEEHRIEDDKSLHYWSTMLIPVVDEDTGEESIFGISREISALKRYEEQLNLTNQKLEDDVAKRTKELQQALAERQSISQHDKLTSLCNRHKLDEEFYYRAELAIFNGEGFGLLLLDIDNFKEINDSFGHHVGEKDLIEFSQLLKNSIRATDVLGRWGGDEFFITVPKANKDKMLSMAQTFENKLANFKSDIFPILSSSIGVSVFCDGVDINSIITRVDKAMYSSKHKGKN